MDNQHPLQLAITQLYRDRKKDRRKTLLTDITGEFNKSVPKTVSVKTIQRELHQQKFWRRTVGDMKKKDFSIVG